MEKQIFSSLKDNWDEIVPDSPQSDDLSFLKVQSKLTRNGCIVALILDNIRRKPVAVVKIPRNPEFTAHIDAEVESTRLLREDGFNADVKDHIPAASIIVELPSQKVLLQSVCQGESMVKSMTGEANISALYTPVLSWLFNMQKQGGSKTKLDGDVLEDLIAQPIARVQKQYTDLYGGLSEAAKKYFEVLPDKVRGSEVMLTLQHGDFNAHNIILGSENVGGFSVIDWEDSLDKQLPVHDVAHFFISNSKIVELQSTADASFEKNIINNGWHKNLFTHAVKEMASNGIIDEAIFFDLVPLYLIQMCLRVAEEGRQQSNLAGVWMDRADIYINNFKRP